MKSNVKTNANCLAKVAGSPCSAATDRAREGHRGPGQNALCALQGQGGGTVSGGRDSPALAWGLSRLGDRCEGGALSQPHLVGLCSEEGDGEQDAGVTFSSSDVCVCVCQELDRRDSQVWGECKEKSQNPPLRTESVRGDKLEPRVTRPLQLLP